MQPTRELCPSNQDLIVPGLQASDGRKRDFFGGILWLSLRA
jgi:hypothetical protein